MSRRNALLVAIVAAIVLAAIFFWPDRARAEFGFSARIGGHHGGFHGGHGGFHGGVTGGFRGGLRGGFRGGRHFGGHFGHNGSFGGRGVRKHDVLIGDRFRFRTLRNVDRDHGRHSGHKGRHGGRRDFLGSDFGHNGSLRHHRGDRKHGLLIGDRFRLNTLRNVNGRSDRHRHGQADHRGQKFRGVGLHRRDRRGHFGPHGGKWLGRAPAILSYDDPDAFVREIIVPVPVAVVRQAQDAPEPPSPLDPRGRVVLVGGEAGVLGEWAPGDVLPDGFPHVALDPLAYGLPQPPSGEKYARVGKDVVRIDALSRRIAEVVAR